MIFSSNKNNYLEDPDVKLLLLFKNGDRRAFETFMKQYYPLVLNFAFRYVANKTIAEDIAQEVFIKVFKSIRTYHPKAKAKTWLFTIVRNVSLNTLRSQKKIVLSTNQSYAADSENEIQFEDSRLSPPSKNMIDKERAERIQKAIKELPENQRTAVILRRYEELSYKEIAHIMKTSEKAVKSLLNRAKENLKKTLIDLIE